MAKARKRAKKAEPKNVCIKCKSSKDLAYSGRYIRDDLDIQLFACKNCEFERIDTQLKCAICNSGNLMWVPKAREMICMNTSCLYTRIFGVVIHESS